MTHAKKAFGAFALSIALVLSMCPLVADSAFAYELASAKTKVRVIDKYGDASLSYNSNGFISKSTNTSTKSKITYKYSGANILSAKPSDSYSATIKAKYKNGRIYQVTYKWKGMLPITDTYTYKKGRVVKVTRKNAGNYLIKYAYDKKGRLSRMAQTFKITKTKSETYRSAYAYDSKGYVYKFTEKAGKQKTTLKYKNTYKNGRLVKRQMVPSYGMPADEITYKTISVPKKYAAKVKAQQRKIFASYGKDQDPLFF